MKIYHHEWYINTMVKRREQWFVENGPCVDCGRNINLEVDHIDPSTKISHCVWSWSEKRRKEELEKCVVRCNECHKIKTASEIRAKLSRPPVHGTSSGYIHHKCRCHLCKDFHKNYRHSYYLQSGK
jgi:hypothetical protein